MYNTRKNHEPTWNRTADDHVAVMSPQKVHPPSLAPSPHRESACPGGASMVGTMMW